MRREIKATDIYKDNFVIYDASDSRTVIKNCLKELNLDDKQFMPAKIQNTISIAKNLMLGPRSYAKQADTFHQRKIAEVFSLYDKKLKENNALDFDDLLMISVNLLETDKELCNKYQRRFQYILIDEYQDTNSAQYRLTTLLAGKHHNICVVGDADQSIYGWRGADISNILNFEKDFPETKTKNLNKITVPQKIFLQRQMLLYKIMKTANLKSYGQRMSPVKEFVFIKLLTNAMKPDSSSIPYRNKKLFLPLRMVISLSFIVQTHNPAC